MSQFDDDYWTQGERTELWRLAYAEGQKDIVSHAMAIVQRELDDPDNHWPIETTLERIRDEIEMLTDED